MLILIHADCTCILNLRCNGLQRLHNLPGELLRKQRLQQKNRNYDNEEQRQSPEEKPHDIAGFPRETHHIDPVCRQHRRIMGISPDGAGGTGGLALSVLFRGNNLHAILVGLHLRGALVRIK